MFHSLRHNGDSKWLMILLIKMQDLHCYLEKYKRNNQRTFFPFIYIIIKTINANYYYLYKSRPIYV